MNLTSMTQGRWNRMSEAERHAVRDFSPHSLLEDARMHRYRVEITYTDGEKARGYVGLTTGWRPAYILLHNARSRGSSNILDPTRITAVRRTVPYRRR